MASSSPAVVFHPVLALSPVRQSFSFIDWTNTRSSTATSFVVVGISRPQALQLQHAQEQPLEYIASEYDHAFSYVRTLLQVLDHVTGPSPPGRILTERLNLIVAPWGEESTTSPNSSIDDASSSALEYLRDDPRGVMTHSILTQLYDFIGVVLTMKQPTQSTPTTSTSTSISTLFYQPSSSQQMSSSSSSLMLELREDWRPLLRILYRTGDAFCQQYAATILMTILMGGGGGRTTNTTTTEDTLKSLISWIISQLQSSHSHTNLQVVLPAIWVLSTCGGPHARRFFFGEGGGIGYLSQHLRRFITTASTTTTTTKKATPKTPPKSPKGTPSSSSPSVQQVYEVLFCLWTMILDIPLATTTTPNDDDILLHSLVRDGTIRMMMQLLSMAPREKIVRMTLRILAQLVRIITSTTTITSSNHHHSRGSAILSEMLVASRHHHSSSTSTTTTTPILETLKSLQLKQEQQQWDDVDMKEGTSHMVILILDDSTPNQKNTTLTSMFYIFAGCRFKSSDAIYSGCDGRADKLGSLSSRIGGRMSAKGCRAHGSLLEDPCTQYGRSPGRFCPGPTFDSTHCALFGIPRRIPSSSSLSSFHLSLQR